MAYIEGIMLTPEEIERYKRQLVLKEIGGEGQQRLKEAKVLVIGAGGLGSPLLLYLAAAGVGRIGIIDDDRVSLDNLQRQVVHDTVSVGVYKTRSAARTIERLNPLVETRLYSTRLQPETPSRSSPTMTSSPTVPTISPRAIWPTTPAISPSARSSSLP
jgi:molybdopterin/thiamine biosynthesis adenylyltransferase